MISVKIPIKWEAMTKRTRQRLRQAVGRDTRVIRAFLNIIKQHENELLTGRNRNRIDETELEKLTMTTTKRAGHSQRLIVPHDFKARFPRISQNEMQECRQTAVATYESYLSLREMKGRRASRPRNVKSTRRMPRWVFSRRFRIVRKRTTTAGWWLDLLDSLDSTLQGKRVHDRLIIPLKTSPFHINQLVRGEVKALQIFTDCNKKWWVTFAVQLAATIRRIETLPPAVLGVDLGIEKAACTTLVTSEKVSETRYFVQRNKVAIIKKHDRLIADIQQEMALQRIRGLSHDKAAKKLRRLRNKRKNISQEYDRVLVREMKNYIQDLSKKYTLYVAIGRLKNIRVRAGHGNYRGRGFRGMIHRWAFGRITRALRHQLAQLGWTVKGKHSRVQVVPENWTSIVCWKCGRKGHRPRQSLFVCSCGFRTHADRNGSLNIARRLITLIPSLRDEKGLGRWAVPERTPAPKAGRKRTSSKRKPLHSKERASSSSGVSAAVHHAQTSVFNLSDGIEDDDDDPAVARTVERLSVVGCDVPTIGQEKKTRSGGGIPS